jgi:hypothetical protein
MLSPHPRAQSACDRFGVLRPQIDIFAQRLDKALSEVKKQLGQSGEHSANSTQTMTPQPQAGEAGGKDEEEDEAATVPDSAVQENPDAPPP